MKLKEVLNLYKYSTDPSKLKAYDKMKDLLGPIKIPLHGGHHISFEDAMIHDPKTFKWNDIQGAHFKKLSEILKRNGLKFTTMWTSDKGAFLSFIVIAGTKDDPKFIWYKYCGHSPQSGQNWVYPSPKVIGSKIQLSQFYRLSPAKQDAMIQSTPPEPKPGFAPGQYDWRVTYSYHDDYSNKDKVFKFKVSSTTPSGARAKVIRMIKRDQAKYEPANWRGFNYYGHISDPVRVLHKVKK